MLSPFRALVPRESDIEYWALERAAKTLRRDPARYQSVEGIEYSLTDPALFLWEIETSEGLRIEGLVGLFPIDALVPHEGIIDDRRPRHPVQIRPVMALIEEPLPESEARGVTVHFHGDHHHAVTPVSVKDLDVPHAVIADGHHRVAAARRAGGDPLIMTMLVHTSEAGLEAGAFHRVFDEIVPLPTALEGCHVHFEPPHDALGAGRIAVVSPLGEVGIEVTNAADPVLEGIPAGLAARHVIPGLGLEEANAAYVDDIRQALEAADAAATVVLLPPADVAAVLSAARRGIALPPKSTRFRPKPIKGLLMRPVF